MSFIKDKKDIKQSIAKVSKLVDNLILELLPEAQGNPEDLLVEAMRYAMLSGGKRIRPFLTVMTAHLFGVSIDNSIRTAVAIEMIHSYSLVHDDLPALDNSVTRRGKPSCHAHFGEATAILTGDALLTYAFEIIANPATDRDSNVRLALIQAIAHAAGHYGMVGGQMIDLNLAKEEEVSFVELVRLQRMKTGAMFSVSCEAGAILGRAPHHFRAAIKSYATSLGIAFQILDDIKDLTEDNPNKPSLVSHLGIEKSIEQAHFLADQAIDAIKVFDQRADLLREFCRFIVNEEPQ